MITPVLGANVLYMPSITMSCLSLQLCYINFWWIRNLGLLAPNKIYHFIYNSLRFYINVVAIKIISLGLSETQIFDITVRLLQIYSEGQNNGINSFFPKIGDFETEIRKMSIYICKLYFFDIYMVLVTLSNLPLWRNR